MATVAVRGSGVDVGVGVGLAVGAGSEDGSAPPVGVSSGGAPQADTNTATEAAITPAARAPQRFPRVPTRPHTRALSIMYPPNIMLTL
ncbi:hypothetical protein GCM10009702_07640 [Propioniferax innocua]